MQQKFIKMRLRLYRYFQLGGSLIPSLWPNLWLLPFLTGGKPGKSGYIIPDFNPLIEIIHVLAFSKLGILYPSPSRYIIPEKALKKSYGTRESADVIDLGIIYPIISRYIIPDFQKCERDCIGILYPMQIGYNIPDNGKRYRLS